ncbi:MAG: hypothetical protein LBR64_10760 [Dysgonamonadaceae bacterium]|jgi:hypothetical protein|nr:hypothetical protein [Dysgonamonadaceae bacterium]
MPALPNIFERSGLFYKEMEKYQGEIINFSLVYEKGESTFNIDDWSGFQQIYVRFYTCGCEQIKFAYPAVAGYNQMTLSSVKKLTGIIAADDSKRLQPGPLILEIKASTSNTVKSIDKKFTGINILRDFVKND